jgi:hypothetical protein
MTKLPKSVPSCSSDLVLSGREAPLSVEVACDGGVVRCTLVDRRPDIVEAFAALDPARAQSLAVEAWRLGLRAEMGAHRVAAESRFEDIGGSLVAQIEQRFEDIGARQQQGMVDTLRSYFDPRDGQVNLRLEAFLKNDGELARTLATYLAPGSGELARTLARELGEQSPLLRRLSPTDTEGVVVMIERSVQATLQQHQARLDQQLDPLAPEGGVARLLAALRREMETGNKDTVEKLAAATRALDTGDEHSMINCLRRESEKATHTIRHEMNADAPGSALALLKSSLSAQLDGHIKRQDEERRASEERQRKMVDDFREAMARFDERKLAESQSTRGGLAFEDAVADQVHVLTRGSTVIVDAVGTTVGHRAGCKVGDLVVRHGPDTLYAGSALVIEAKREKGYTVTRALQELDTARQNRGATAGLFVMSRSHVPAGFGGFRVFGNDVLVVWDAEDPSTNAYLDASLVIGLLLAARGRRQGDPGQIDALADIEARIAKEIERHEAMRSHVDGIQRHAEALQKELSTSDKKLKTLADNARKTLKALNVEQTDIAEERKSPIGLLPAAPARGRKALGPGKGEA